MGQASFADSLALANLNRKLDTLDVDFVMESIAQQLKNPIENTINRDFLKRFEKQYKAIKEQENYDPEIDDQRDVLYLDIKNKLESFLDITLEYDDDNLCKICKHMYRFFVVDLVDNITKFLEMYIINNPDEVLGMIDYQSNNVSVIAAKENFPNNPKIGIITANIYQSVQAIIHAPINFETFLKILDDHVDSSSSVDMIKKYYEKNIDDNSSLYSNIMLPLSNENEGYCNILNKLSIKLFEKFGTMKELEESNYGEEIKEEE